MGCYNILARTAEGMGLGSYHVRACVKCKTDALRRLSSHVRARARFRADALWRGFSSCSSMRALKKCTCVCVLVMFGHARADRMGDHHARACAHCRTDARAYTHTHTHTHTRPELTRPDPTRPGPTAESSLTHWTGRQNAENG